MKRLPALYLLPFFSLPFISACGGGGGSSSTPLPSTAQIGSSSEVQSFAQSEALRLPLASSSDLLYIGNPGNNSITVYEHDASGNTAPIKVISGSKTELNDPGQLSEDAQGNLYVANGPYFPGGGTVPSSSVSVLVFAHGANGNVAPIRRLAGPSTGLHYVEAMTVDQTTGKIFVFDTVSPQDVGSSSLLRFEPNATGNTAPYARSVSEFQPALQIASDSTGDNIIEARGLECCTAFEVGTATIAKQFPANGSPSVPYEIDGLTTYGVADDPTTKEYLVTGYEVGGSQAGIFRFAEDTTGYFEYGGSPTKLNHPVVSIITSDTCGTQLAVAPGPTPNTYVTHSTQYHCPKDAVYVYTHSASGNAAPLRVLSGSATKLNKPYGIYEGK